MYLHDDPERFVELIEDCSKKTLISEAMIEKDYYVSLFLKHLIEAEPNIIFKGGTCLSKCFKLIDRFSEDIDLTMRPNATQKQKKGMKYHIIDVAKKLGLEHTNADSVVSGRPFAEHIIKFPTKYASAGLKPFLLVETFFRRTTASTLVLPTSSLLYEYLKEEGAEEIIAKYGLGPFDATVQSLPITLIDKLHALNSNYLKGKITSYSRHLYDIHKILPHVVFNEEFFRLLKELGENDRKALAGLRRPILFDPADLTASLRKIVSENVYKNDYETTTLPLLFKKVPYEDAVRSLRTALTKIDGIEEGSLSLDPPMNFIIRSRRTAKA